MAGRAKALKVCAQLVEVDMGDRRVRFSHGDVLPDGVSEDSVEHLKELGYVEETDAAPADSDSK